MAAPAVRQERPATVGELAGVLREAGDAPVRVFGAGTKPWGRPGEPPAVELSTTGLDRVLEHNVGDLTAVLEAGVPVVRAQAQFAQARQTLMLDPPLGAGEAATIGGVLSAGDSGPRRHRYGGPRDLVLGVRVALADGTLARSGGKVIKNVAGYDLAKLYTGAFGTLGVICEVAVRLHPLPAGTATLVARAGAPDAVAGLASVLARARIETEALDVRWDGADGAVLARYGGTAAPALAASAREALAGADADAEVVDDDDALWDEQRARQRGALVARVSGRLTDLPRVIRAARDQGGTLVGRAALGLSWVSLPATVEAAQALRAALAPRACVVLDAPEAVRGALDPWGLAPGPELELMRRVKARFDPAGSCNRGIYVGGL
jgi:glycolate oxidase FAD binding subunit